MIFKLACVVACAVGLSLAKGIFDEKSVQEFLRETVVAETSGNISITATLIRTMQESEAHPPTKFASGIVSQKCLGCICMVESGCKNIGCRMDVGSLSCGYFQIKERYWQDCGKLGKGWKACAADQYCASECVQKYMNRYAKWAGCPLECEGFAREHNGGPRGCKNPNTMGYWERLQREPGCRGVK